MAIVLALLSALCYGTSDFIGGVLSARIRPWTAAFTGQLAGGVTLTLIAVLARTPPSWAGTGWGALAGVGGGLGVLCLYRGLARGRMGVVAPVSGVMAALVPAVVGVALGDRPSLLSWLGMLLALPATWLVAGGADAGAASRHDRSGLLDGVLAGTGFGLSFAAIAQAPSAAGVWPVALELLVASAVAVVGAVLAREAWFPRTPTAALTVSTGLLAASALTLFLAATHRGMLAITGIIASLYPAATVLLAVMVLRERVHRAQAAGLALCALAVVLVAGG